MLHVTHAAGECHRDAGVLGGTRGILDEEERGLIVDYLAYNPTGGKLIPGTGGLRKLRWASKGRGKRGGARIIYYFHNGAVPLFALTAHAKNQRADLSQADRNDFRRLIALLVESYVKRSKR